MDQPVNLLANEVLHLSLCTVNNLCQFEFLSTAV